jgi:hypothetical protein
MYYKHKCSSLKSVVLFTEFVEEHKVDVDGVLLVPDGELLELDTHFEFRTYSKLDYCPFCGTRHANDEA